MYKDYIYMPINPTTNLSTFFDPDHYKGETEYRNRVAHASKQNNIVEKLKVEILQLTAYGVQPAIIKKVLSIYKPELNSIRSEAFKSLASRWCIYYSRHLKELHKLIGNDWKVKAEQLIEYYEHNKFRPKRETNFDETPVSIGACIEDIRYYLEKLLVYANYNTPSEFKIKDLNIQEQVIKEQINKCEDLEMLNSYYAKLVSLLGNKKEFYARQSQAEQLKAIRILKSCGFIEAAYKWLNCFPKN